MCCAVAAVAASSARTAGKISAAPHKVLDWEGFFPRLGRRTLDPKTQKAMMMLKKTLAAAAALSLAATPVLAQSRAPIEPASEQVEGSEIRGGVILPSLALIALILAVLKLTDSWPFDEDPQSP
jgi:hypothetical protein